MGEEFGMTITDLGPCADCGMHNGMIFQEKTKKDEDRWYIACGYRKCEHKTKTHKELIDAGDEWGLMEME